MASSLGRALIVAAITALTLSSVATATPAITVTAVRKGPTASLPAKVQHRLTLTAGAASEQVTVTVSPSARLVVSGDAQSVQPPRTGVGPSVAVCPGHWTRFHEPYRGASPLDTVTLTLAPGQTAFVDATVTLARPPWADETLDATWLIEPARGRAFDVVSNAPLYTGPIGVELGFHAIRGPDGRFVFAGTAAPDVDSGHVELWAFPPGREHAHRVARVRVRDGEWSVTGFQPSRRGRWEFYARYRTAGGTFADDASDCGTIVRVR